MSIPSSQWCCSGWQGWSLHRKIIDKNLFDIDKNLIDKNLFDIDKNLIDKNLAVRDLEAFLSGERLYFALLMFLPSGQITATQDASGLFPNERHHWTAYRWTITERLLSDHWTISERVSPVNPELGGFNKEIVWDIFMVYN